MENHKPSVSFISALSLLGVLLIPSIVFAYDIEYFTYGGFVPMEQTFKRIALIFSDTSYKGLAFVVLVASIMCSGAASFVKGAAGGKSGPFSWFIPLILGGILYISFFTHTGTVHLYDAVLNKTAVIAGVPDGITFLAGTTNKVKRGFVDLIDTAGGVNTPSYKTGGTGIGFDLSSRMMNISPVSVAAYETVTNYTKDCILFEIARTGTTLTPDKIYNSSTDIVTTLAEAQNPAVMTTSALDASGNPISPGEPVSCTTAYNRFKPYYNNTANLGTAYSSICGQVGYDAAGVALCKDRITEVLNKEAGAGSCNIDADKFLSNMMISKAVHREIGMSSGMGSIVANNATAAKNGIGAWTNLTEWMPFMRAILLVIQISLIPLIAIFIPSPFGRKAIAIIVGFFIFDMAWEITDALIYGVSTDYFTTYFQNCASNQGLSFYLQFPDASTKVLSALGTARMASFGFATLLSGLFMGATNSVLGSVGGHFKPYEDPVNAKGAMYTPGAKEEYSARMASVQSTASNMNKFGFDGTTTSMANKGASDLGSGLGFGSGSSGQDSAFNFGQHGTQKNVTEQQAQIQAAGGAASWLQQRAEIAHTGQQKEMGTVADWQSYLQDAKKMGLKEDQAIAFGGMFMKGKDASAALHATKDKHDGDLAKATGLNADERKDFRKLANEAMQSGDYQALFANEKFHQAYMKLGGQDFRMQAGSNAPKTLQDLSNNIARKDFKSIADSPAQLAAMGALLGKNPESLKKEDMTSAEKKIQAMGKQQMLLSTVDKSVQAAQENTGPTSKDTRDTKSVMQDLSGNLEKGNWEQIRKDPAQMAAMGALVGVTSDVLTKEHMPAAQREINAATAYTDKMERMNTAIQSAPTPVSAQAAPKRDEKAVTADLQRNLQTGNFDAIRGDSQQLAAMAALTGKAPGSVTKEDMGKAKQQMDTMSANQTMQSQVSTAIQSAPSGQQAQAAPKRDEKAVTDDLQRNLQTGNFDAIRGDSQQLAAMAALTGKAPGSVTKDDMGKAKSELQGRESYDDKIRQVDDSVKSAQQQSPRAQKRDTSDVMSALEYNLQGQNFKAIKQDQQQLAAMGALLGKDPAKLTADDMPKANKSLIDMNDSNKQMDKVMSASDQASPPPAIDPKRTSEGIQTALGNLDKLEDFDNGKKREMFVGAKALEEHRGLVGADAEKSRLEAVQALSPQFTQNDSMAMLAGKGVTLDHDQAGAAQAAGNKGMLEGFTYSNPVVNNGRVSAADVQGVVGSGNIAQLRENLTNSNQPELAAGLKEGMMVRGTIDPRTGQGTWAAEEGASVRNSNSMLSETRSKQSITGAELMEMRDSFGPHTQKWLDQQSKQKGFAGKQYHIETSRAVDGKPGQAATVTINSGSEAKTVDFATGLKGSDNRLVNRNISETDIGNRSTVGDKIWSGSQIIREDTNIDQINKGLRKEVGNQEWTGNRKVDENTNIKTNQQYSMLDRTLTAKDDAKLILAMNEKLEREGSKQRVEPGMKMQAYYDMNGQLVSWDITQGGKSAITDLKETKKGDVSSDYRHRKDVYSGTNKSGSGTEVIEKVAKAAGADQVTADYLSEAGATVHDVTQGVMQYAQPISGTRATMRSEARYQENQLLKQEATVTKAAELAKHQVQQSINKTAKVLQHQSKNSPLPKGPGPARGQIRR